MSSKPTEPLTISKWAYDLGGGGWGNNELQTYTDDPQNVVIEDGSAENYRSQ